MEALVATRPGATDGELVVIKNHTTHPLVFQGLDGTEVVVPPEPIPARVEVDRDRHGTIQFLLPDGNRVVVPRVRRRWGTTIAGLPAPEPGVLRIVSAMVYEGAERTDRGVEDLLVPDDLVRDALGRVRAARAVGYHVMQDEREL